MNGPFTRDVSKLDSVAKAVLEMRGKVPSEQEQLDEGITNPNSSGQGYDDTHHNHPLHSTITNHGYHYSHSTPIHKQDGTIYTHHTYARGEHKVGVNAHSHEWESKTSSASGHRKRGTGHDALDKHLKGKAKRYTYDEETEQLDELSKKTLKSYKKQALGSSHDSLQRRRDSAYISGNQKGVADVDRKMKNRYYGHKAATEKLKKK